MGNDNRGSDAGASPFAQGQAAVTASWTCERQDGDGGDANAGDDVYADIYWAIHDARTYDFIANVHSNERHARLIAAAPDMKARLEATLHTLGLMADAYPLGSATRNTLEDECREIRAAISKAKE
jgi:hypothetical protein